MFSLLPGLALGMFAAPALAMLSAAWPMLHHALGLRRAAQSGRRRIEITILIGRLVHEMQKERGLSVAHLAGPGAPALLAQRQGTQAAEASLRAALGPDGADGLAALDGLAHWRSCIDAGTIAAPELVEAFSTVIARLLSLSSSMVRGATRGRLSRLAMASVNLMNAKELAGQERAMISGALGRGSADDGLRRRLVRAMGGQDIYLRLFRDLAGVDLVTEMDRRLAELDPPVQAIRRDLLEEGSWPAVAVPQWFAMATARMDALKAQEDRLGKTLLEASATLERMAARRPWAIASFGAASLATLAAAFVLLPAAP